MKLALPVLLFASWLAFSTPAQLHAPSALEQPQFVELDRGNWRAFPSAAAAIEVRDRSFGFRSRDGAQAIDLELPPGWTVRADMLSETRFTEIRSSGARTLAGAHSLVFESADKQASLRVRLCSREEAELTWSSATPSALAGVSLRLPGSTEMSADLRSRIRGAFGDQEAVWVVTGDQRLGISADAAESIVAAPLVQKMLFASFLGGSLWETVHDVEATEAGDLLIAGTTSSLEFPATPETYDPVVGPSSDAFLLGLSRDGGSLLFGTFFGGSDFDTFDLLAHTSDGSILLTGRTGSADLPTSASAFDGELTGESDDFLAHLSADGSALISATYLGGSTAFPESIEAIFIDSNDGSILIVGDSNTPADWPTTKGSFAPDPLNIGNSESFVTRLSSDLSSILASTYFGSNSIAGARLLSDGSVVFSIVGALSRDLPQPLPGGGAFPNTIARDENALVRMSADLSSVVWSTWVPGIIRRIEEKSDGSLVLLGLANAGFPTTPRAFNPTKDPGLGSDLVVCNITAGGEKLIWSTYINAGSVHAPTDSALDEQERIFFVSPLNTASYPFTPDAFDSTVAAFGEGQITVLDATGSELLYASSLGVSGAGAAMSLDNCGGAFVGGTTNNSSLVATPGALDETFNGLNDGWVLRITTLNPWTNFGHALAGSTGEPALAPSGPLCEGDATSIEINSAVPGGSGFLVIGFSPARAPLKGGLLIPAPDLLTPFSLDGNGEYSLGFEWPAGAPAGFEFWLQAWILDPAATSGFSSTNGVRGITP